MHGVEALTDQDWVIRRDVPVYDGHIIVDRITGKEYPVTQERLQEIADRSNRRVDQTGDECPLIVGHTKDDLPEWDQPPIVGYASEFYVEHDEKLKRPVMYARNYKLYKKSFVGDREMDAEEIMRRFPRRSAEVWLKDKIIDPISLLGATTPMRDLGLVRNAKRTSKRGKPLKYGMGGSGVDVPAVITALEAMLSQLKGVVSPPEGTFEEELPNDTAPPEVEGDQEDGFDGDDDKEKTGDEPLQYESDSEDEGDSAMASGTNDFLPGDDEKKKKKYEKPKEAELERVQMQRDQKAIEAKNLSDRVASLESQLKEANERSKADRVKYQRQVRAADLKQLVSEGYSLEVDEEIDELAELPDDQYTKRLGQIRKRYSRVPLGEDFILTAKIKEGGPAPVSREMSQKAAEIAAKRGEDFGKVLRELQNG